MRMKLIRPHGSSPLCNDSLDAAANNWSRTIFFVFFLVVFSVSFFIFCHYTASLLTEERVWVEETLRLAVEQTRGKLGGALGYKN